MAFHVCSCGHVPECSHAAGDKSSLVKIQFHNVSMRIALNAQVSIWQSVLDSGHFSIKIGLGQIAYHKPLQPLV